MDFTKAWLSYRKYLSWSFSLIGIIIYIGLTGFAISLYPGGNKFDRQYVGYSFKNNFWCDLFSEVAYNGMQNPGRPHALLGNYVVAFALLFFWFSVSDFFQSERKQATLVRVLGSLAMIASLLVSTRLHDVGMHTAVPLGMLAFFLTLHGLWRSREKILVYVGGTAALMILINYLSLILRVFPQHLALVQKWAIGSFLTWVVVCLVRRYFITLT